MFRPFHSYTELRRSSPQGGLWLALRRPALFLMLMGAFVSISSSGRLVVVHLVGGALSWAFLPVIQTAVIAAVAHAVARGESKSRAVDLYFMGQGPWLLLLFGLCAICLFSADVYGTFRVLLQRGILPAAILVTTAWSTLLTWACLRRGMSLGAVRSAVGLVAFYAVYGGALVSYFAVTNQLQPLLVASAS